MVLLLAQVKRQLNLAMKTALNRSDQGELMKQPSCGRRQVLFSLSHC